MKGIASLSASYKPEDISAALKKALSAVRETGYKARIKEFVDEYFCMQKQLTPIIQFIDNIKKQNMTH
jgi:hypothetical protein